MPEENKDAKIGVNDNIPAIYDKNGEILRNTKTYNESFLKFIYNFLSRYDKKNIEVVIFFITIISILSQVSVYSYEVGRLDYFNIDKSVIENFSMTEIIYNSCIGLAIFILYLAYVIINKYSLGVKKYTCINLSCLSILYFINYISSYISFQKDEIFNKNNIFTIFIIVLFLVYMVFIIRTILNEKYNKLAYFFTNSVFLYIFYLVMFASNKKIFMSLNIDILIKGLIFDYKFRYILLNFCCLMTFCGFILVYFFDEESKLERTSFNYKDIIIGLIFIVFVISIITAIPIYLQGFNVAKNKEDFKVITQSEYENGVNRLIVYENSEKYVTFRYIADKNMNLIILFNTQKIISKDNIEFENKSFSLVKDIGVLEKGNIKNIIVKSKISEKYTLFDGYIDESNRKVIITSEKFQEIDKNEIKLRKEDIRNIEGYEIILDKKNN